jgi:hypothetical protein
MADDAHAVLSPEVDELIRALPLPLTFLRFDLHPLHAVLSRDGVELANDQFSLRRVGIRQGLAIDRGADEEVVFERIFQAALTNSGLDRSGLHGSDSRERSGAHTSKAAA